jgi:hypothetical protein
VLVPIQAPDPLQGIYTDGHKLPDGQIGMTFSITAHCKQVQQERDAEEHTGMPGLYKAEGRGFEN